MSVLLFSNNIRLEILELILERRKIHTINLFGTLSEFCFPSEKYAQIAMKNDRYNAKALVNYGNVLFEKDKVEESLMKFKEAEEKDSALQKAPPRRRAPVYATRNFATRRS